MTASQQRLSVSKDYIFLTFQGEGPRLGTRTVFLRLAGCNLTCSWCDTPYTWNWSLYNIKKETRLETVAGVSQDLQALDCRNLTITGGEPLLQAKALDALFLLLDYKEINFETNGTIFPHWTSPPCQINYVVSPKLANSGCPSNIAPGFYNCPTASFKFVVAQPKDLDEIERFELPPEKIWIMPEGTDSEILTTRLRLLAPYASEKGYNLTTRLHQYIWGNMRGR